MSILKKVKSSLILLFFLLLLSTAVTGYYFYSQKTKEISLPLRTLPSPTPTVSKNFDDVESIVGNFKEWEEIGGFEDKYILLTIPQTEKLFPKARVGFEFSPLFGDQTGRADATVFAVRRDGEEYDVLGYLKDFTPEEVDKLIKPGDTIKIVLKKKMDKMENLKDDNGNLLAHWLLIKGEE